jgi:hypothetical protein
VGFARQDFNNDYLNSWHVKIVCSIYSTCHIVCFTFFLSHLFLCLVSCVLCLLYLFSLFHAGLGNSKFDDEDLEDNVLGLSPDAFSLHP